MTLQSLQIPTYRGTGSGPVPYLGRHLAFQKEHRRASQQAPVTWHTAGTGSCDITILTKRYFKAVSHLKFIYYVVLQSHDIFLHKRCAFKAMQMNHYLLINSSRHGGIRIVHKWNSSSAARSNEFNIHRYMSITGLKPTKGRLRLKNPPHQTISPK